MASRTDLREDALKLGVSILQSAKDPEHILKHNKYFGTAFKWDLQKESFERFLTHPQIQPLVSEQFAVPWPSPDDMRAMPIGSLGFCMQRRRENLGIDALPAVNKEMEKIIKTSTKEEYLLRRIRSTHDIHHLVLGVDTSVAGEAAVSAYYAVSQQMPASIVPLATWMTHSFIEPSEHRRIWEGISFGTQVGLAGVFLEGCRWEEGWERPLEAWRSELGLVPLLEKSPFQDEINRYKTFTH